MVLSHPTPQTYQMRVLGRFFFVLDDCYMVNIWEQAFNNSTLITQSWHSLLK